MKNLIIILLFFAGLYGWIMNIVSIINSDLIPLTTLLVVRVIGIFIPPIGAVLGYF